MDNKKKLRGYGFSRKANGQFVPQRIQNMIIRQYVESKECEFLLSAFEYYMDDCYMMLASQLEKINDIDGLVFYSLSFLPQGKEKREEIYKKVLKEKKELHFAIENLSICNEDDVNAIEEIIAFNELSGNVSLEAAS